MTLLCQQPELLSNDETNRQCSVQVWLEKRSWNMTRYAVQALSTRTYRCKHFKTSDLGVILALEGFPDEVRVWRWR